MDKTIYDIAISYSRVSEEFARKLYSKLSDRFNVFMDIMAYDLLVCTYIHEILYDIYYNRSNFAILIISQEYLTRPHPLWEARTVVAKSVEFPDRFFIILEDDVDVKEVRKKLCINNNYIFCRMSDLDGDSDLILNIIEKRVIE